MSSINPGPSRSLLGKLLGPEPDLGIIPTLPELPAGHPKEIFANVKITKPKCLAGSVTVEVWEGHSVRILKDDVLRFRNNAVLDFKIVLYDVSKNTCAAIVSFDVPGLGLVQMQMQQRIAVMCLLAHELMHFGYNFPLWHVLVKEYFLRMNGAADEVEEKSKKLLEMEQKLKSEVESRRQNYLNSRSRSREPEGSKRKRESSEESAKKNDLFRIDRVGSWNCEDFPRLN